MRPENDRLFAQLLSENHDRLDAAARRMVRDEHDAADVLQEVYLRAWKGLPSFRGEAKPFTWLYAILVNTVRTFIRKRRRREVALAVEAGEFHELVDDDRLIDPEARLELHHLQDEVDSLVASLPPTLRVAAVHDLVGLTDAAVADQLAISTGAAKVRRHRARRHMREVILTRLTA